MPITYVEKEIFLESRKENDVQRNAMVGIFLRLLEYHDYVFFLTTNRVENFDHVFHIGISISIKYYDLDTDTRKQMYENLLVLSNIKNINTQELLSNYGLNGRKIHNIIRLEKVWLKMKKQLLAISIFVKFYLQHKYYNFDHD